MATKGKEFPLSITVKAVDRATSGLKRINDRLKKTFEPFKKFRDEASDLGKNMGLPKIADSLRGIGSVVKSLAIGFGALSAASFGAFHVIKGMVDEFDELGGTASRLGMTVDGLAQLRFAAQKSDVEVTELDAALGSFNKGLGQARAKTGKLYGFLGKVSPVLRRQILATKSSEEAFALMADAMVKVQDPAKRAALATAVFGGSGQALIPLLARGSKGVDELRKRHLELAGSQEGAAAAAGDMDDALIDAQTSIKSIKGQILVGLAPAFVKLTGHVTEFFTANRERIAQWAKDFGEKLPSRIDKLVAILREVGSVLAGVGRAIGWVVDKVGGAENAVKLLVGGFLAFKGLQLATHIGGIVQGLVGVAAGATGAMGAIGKLGGAIPILAAVAVGAQAAANALDRAQTADIDEKVTKGGVMDAFRSFQKQQNRLGTRGDDAARRALVRKLRTEGLIDERTGLLKKSAHSMFKTSEGWWNPFHDQGKDTQSKVDEVNRILRTGPIAGPGITSPLLGAEKLRGPANRRAALTGEAAPSKAEVTIKVEPAPGTRAKTTINPRSDADVNVSSGPQLVPGL